MLAKKTSKNQITLPKKIADTFPGIDYFNIGVENGNIVLRPVQPDHIYQVRDKLEELGIAEQDISEAIEWARTHKS
jgi:bifunctional DNA-binding transcriptional regulator/antitoxin component of YhaV-PrlF toxin-antitoxin module